MKNIKDNINFEKELYNEADDVIVGKTQIYRVEFDNLSINVHEEMSSYPFDEQILSLRIDVQPIDFESTVIRFNMHDSVDITKNLILSVNSGTDLNKMDIFCLYSNKKGFDYKFIPEPFVCFDNNTKKS